MLKISTEKALKSPQSFTHYLYSTIFIPFHTLLFPSSLLLSVKLKLLDEYKFEICHITAPTNQVTFNVSHSEHVFK